MKILILGATGYLGSTLFDLASRKENVVVYGTSRYPNENVNIIQVDVTDKLSIENVISQLEPEIIIWSIMDGEKENLLTDLGLTNLLTIIQKETRLIFLSTDALFVDGTGGFVESDKTGSLPSDAPLSTYVNAKMKAENIIRSCHINHVILRTGPLYGENFNQNIEQRTKRILKQIKEGQPTKAASNLYKTFVHVVDLSNAVLEVAMKEFTGMLHVGPMQKESYYSFYQKRLTQLGYDRSAVHPYLIEEGHARHLPLDTSLNTKKAKDLLKTHFRAVVK
ncbi:sugar nucleotide-binding protein [Psychrobacillus sp. NPDC096426]|uniref:sugar nucleotide-binding protein n=1 Tax=Psychrobacillus sp. NPDC096426 TaxID=3364491 RepID=UPI00382F08A1